MSLPNIANAINALTGRIADLENNTNNSSNVALMSAGGISLVNDGFGPGYTWYVPNVGTIPANTGTIFPRTSVTNKARFGNWVIATYDTPKSIKAKAALVRQYNMKGLVMWDTCS